MANLLDWLRPDFPKESKSHRLSLAKESTSLSIELFFQGHFHSGSKVLELNPSLHIPFQLDVRQRSIEDSEPVCFEYKGRKTLSLRWLVPMAGLPVRVAKTQWANYHQDTTGPVFGIFDGLGLLDDDSILYPSAKLPYQVRTDNLRYLHVRFAPQPANKFPSVLRRYALIDLGYTSTAASFCTFLSTTLGCSVKFRSNVGSLRELSDDAVLELIYPGSGWSTAYRFRERGQTVDESMFISPEQRVSDVKLSLLTNRPHVLPTTLGMSVWYCELRDEEFLISYGIPPNSLIVFYSRFSLQISVNFEGKKEEYTVSAFDRIRDLKSFIALETEIPLTSLGSVVGVDGSVIPDIEFICDIAEKEISILREREIRVSAPGGEIALNVRPDTTFRDLLADISDRIHIEFPFLSILAGGDIISDLTHPISSIAGPFAIRIIQDTSSSNTRIVKCTFKGIEKEIELDSSTPVSAFKAAIAEPFGVSPESIEVKFDGAFLDQDITLSDLPGVTELAIEAKHIHEIKEYHIWIVNGDIPRRRSVRFPSGITVRDALIRLKGLWSLEWEPELSLINIDDDEDVELVAEDAVLDQIDISNSDIAVRPKPVVVSVPSPHLGGELVGSFERRSSLLDLCEPPPGEGDLEFRFVYPDKDESFAIRFMGNQTVQDARKKVAEKYFVEPDDVKLLVGGKALKDPFILERLRLGSRPINIFIRNMDEVLLLTARAMRSD
jgi:hypothetical protein